MKKWMVCLIIPFFISCQVVLASVDKIDQTSLQQAQTVLSNQKSDVSLIKMVEKLASGNFWGAMKYLWQKISEELFHSLIINQKFLRQMIIASLVAAVFKTLSDSFFPGNAGNTAFYVTYVLLIGFMADSFYFFNETTQNLMQTISDYMKGMITAYSIAIVSTAGVSTSTAVYEFYLMLIYVMSMLTKHLIFPMIKVFFVLKMINHISEEEYFSRLCKSIQKIVKLSLKGFLSIILGIQMIQSMLLPAMDSLKNTAFQKGISSIPGLGGGMNSVMTTMLGGAVVIKNSIGAAGILILIFLIVPPLLQIGVVVLSYVGTGILLQPVSDRRVTGAMDAVIQSGKMMLSTILTITALFILSIAMIAFSTNVNYYAG